MVSTATFFSRWPLIPPSLIFSNVMKQVVLRGRSRPLNCTFYCKKGRHRSVAVAFPAAASLAKITHWEATVTHLADQSWPFNTCNFVQSAATRPTLRRMQSDLQLTLRHRLPVEQQRSSSLSYRVVSRRRCPDFSSQLKPVLNPSLKTRSPPQKAIFLGP